MRRCDGAPEPLCYAAPRSRPEFARPVGPWGALASRLLRFLTALVRYRDVRYARRLLGRAAANLRLVTGGLGAAYVRVHPYRDFCGVEDAEACERFEMGRQPDGLILVNLAAYHLALEDVRDRVVVDAGTNEGYGAALFARAAREVHAFDRSEAAIAVARSRFARPDLHFTVHDATRPFPLADGSADVVFSSEVLEHLADGRAFVEAAWRALRPGGLLIVKTPNDCFNRLENRLNPHHLKTYDARSLGRLLATRFEGISIRGLTYRVELATAPENRPTGIPVDERPYRFGDPIEIDRVLVTRMRVIPTPVPDAGGEAEYLYARAIRVAGS
jgi:SAM-dependent methyltransferase